jgi:hypothetical protein
MARTYKRDGNGRFAGGGGSSGGGGSKRPAAKSVSRGVNRLTRDNAGKITSVGGSGATARGGRLKTAAGNKRAMQTAKVSGGKVKGTIKGKLKRDPGAAGKVGQGKSAAKPTAKPSAAKPAKAIKATQQQRNIREFMDQKRGAVARDYKNDAQAFRLPLAKKDQVAGGPRTVGGALEASATKSYKKTTSKSSLTSSEIAKAQKLITDNNIKGYKVVKNEYGYSLLRNSGVSAKAAKLAEAAITRKAARKPAAAAKPATPKPVKAVPKSTARPLSQRETQNLGLAKSNLAISKERLAFAREAKTTAKGPLEKLKATNRINEQQSNIRQISNKITGINARPAPGRPITGADRSGNRKQLSAPKKSGAIKGSIKRDASAPSNLKDKSALNAGKYKNIYMANANKAAAAKRKRKP